MSDAVTWGAIVTAIGALATIVGFWTRYSDRITKAEAAAAATAAAEAKRAAEAAIAEVKRTSEAAIGEAKRDAQAASQHAAELAAKLYQVEIWSRDEFVRKSSFEMVVSRLERGFAELKQDISGRLDRMTDRIETIKSNSPQH
ncbi:hypothetical protein HU675_0035180 [Bradyrhizobium septentrionale]|uniref:hypothetical protein n=1 Tax=Bradyrhizobium septentrionale TaxID=1404411 RepID=UPI0015966629|nr:hypothetical protein [Bradyrhizobium septentrionale]UGY23161.1 hypothetical protein HU675_0035180 [Bradyrhizobium septentrionale]